MASHQEITVTLAGCTTKAHVDDAVRAVENLVEEPAQVVASKLENAGVSLNNLCTGCGYCDSCPVGIPIPKFMDSYNMKILTGKEGAIGERLENHWGLGKDIAGQCVACGACEAACTQHLPIIQRLAQIGG